MRQLVLAKENSEFKPVKLRLKIDLVSYLARAERLGKYDMNFYVLFFWVSFCICEWIYICVCVCVCIFLSELISMCACVWVWMFLCMWVYVCMCICVLLYECVFFSVCVCLSVKWATIFESVSISFNLHEFRSVFFYKRVSLCVFMNMHCVCIYLRARVCVCMRVFLSASDCLSVFLSVPVCACFSVCNNVFFVGGLSVIWKSDLTDKMKRSFFQAAIESILLYGCTTWTLSKRLEKKLDGKYTRMLRARLN